MSSRSTLLRSAVLATLAATALPLAAQEARGTQEGRGIDTIVVTAQKREQSLQDVPLVVTAVSEQLLQDAGVKDIKDLTLLTPGLIVTSTSSETVTTARIRGIGTVGDNPGLESSVGVVIDGVYRPRNGVSFGDLGELERIEVLKGPQGTLFGKNTSAGVINVVSKRPSFDFGSQIELTAGDYGDLGGSASITGPIAGDVVAGRLFVAARERDGFIDVVTGPGPRVEDEDFTRSFYTVRGQLLVQPSDALDIRFVADYTDRDEDCCAAPQVTLSPTPAVGGVLNAIVPGSFANPPDPFDRVAFSNRSTEQQIEDTGASMEINWDLDGLGGATLTSITARRNWETVNGQDSDFTTVDILYRAPDGGFATEFTQLSEELRLSGENERVSWLVGAFYADEDLDSANQLTYGQQFGAYFSGLLGNPAPFVPLLTTQWPGGVGQADIYEQDSESWALFTNNSIRITDALELTLVIRMNRRTWSHGMRTEITAPDVRRCAPTSRPSPGSSIHCRRLRARRRCRRFTASAVQRMQTPYSTAWLRRRRSMRTNGAARRNLRIDSRMKSWRTAPSHAAIRQAASISIAKGPITTSRIIRSIQRVPSQLIRIRASRKSWWIPTS
jgi:outer membrane receptor protein involved in Fe transport